MAVNKFQLFCDQNNIKLNISTSKETARTALDAAKVNNVPVSNIVKSILLKVDDNFILYLVPGDSRIDLDIIKSKHNAETVRMANADEVKTITGYSIGGVPPFGHALLVPIYFYEGFQTTQELVAAAGFHNATFKISYSELKTIIETLAN